jgi:dihydrofolate reductase
VPGEKIPVTCPHFLYFTAILIHMDLSLIANTESQDENHLMRVSAIVAVASNGVIGDGHDIPWRLSDDLKLFKKITTGHHIIMGRKTYDSIGRPLPNRVNIVVTRDVFFTANGVLTAHSLEQALEIAWDARETEAFIIGGGEIYQQSMSYWDRIYLTEVNCAPDASVYFPPIKPEEWTTLESSAFPANEKNEYAFTFTILDRKVTV